ncbi:MAG: hypothetical protein WCJ84_05550 [Candidatus Peregrinibacteria bacterium]
MTRQMFDLRHNENASTNIIISNWSTELNDWKITGSDEFWLLLRVIRNYRESMGWDLNCTIHFFMDEVGSLFNSREFKNLGGEENGFVTQLRKMGVFLYYGVQHPASVDIVFRRVTEQVRACRPWLPVGKMDLTGRRAPFGFKQKTMEFDENNVKSEELVTVDEEIFLSEKKFFDLYNTHECLEMTNKKLPETPEELLAYQLDFEEKLEKLLEERKPSFMRKVLNHIYIPNPFYYL